VPVQITPHLTLVEALWLRRRGTHHARQETGVMGHVRKQRVAQRQRITRRAVRQS